MPIYITLNKLTEQGIKDIKNVSKRYKDGVKVVEDLGGKVLGFYSTMGEYDYVGIGELPNDEAAVLSALTIGSQGNVRTTTLKAIPQKDFEKLIKKLP